VVLNGEKTIGQTIGSVLSQTYTRLEYIVLDGASSDNTVEVIRSFEKDTRLRWISEPDQGIADAWNKGIGMASGQLIGLINADDWYEQDAVEKMVRRMTNTSGILCGNVRLWNNSKKFNIKKSTLKGIRTEMTIWHPGMFCPRKIYEEAGLYDPRLKILMDYDFVIRCWLKGVRFTFVDEPVANMRFGGLSNKLISMSMKEALFVKNRYFGVRLRHYFEYGFFMVFFHIIIFLKKIIYG
jgi:glycosyltransferase involved in cell wall biosynthesis